LISFIPSHSSASPQLFLIANPFFSGPVHPDMAFGIAIPLYAGHPHLFSRFFFLDLFVLLSFCWCIASLAGESIPPGCFFWGFAFTLLFPRTYSERNGCGPASFPFFFFSSTFSTAFFKAPYSPYLLICSVLALCTLHPFGLPSRLVWSPPLFFSPFYGIPSPSLLFSFICFILRWYLPFCPRLLPLFFLPSQTPFPSGRQWSLRSFIFLRLSFLSCCSSNRVVRFHFGQSLLPVQQNWSAFSFSIHLERRLTLCVSTTRRPCSLL